MVINKALSLLVGGWHWGGPGPLGIPMKNGQLVFPFQVVQVWTGMVDSHALAVWQMMLGQRDMDGELVLKWLLHAFTWWYLQVWIVFLFMGSMFWYENSKMGNDGWVHPVSMPTGNHEAEIKKLESRTSGHTLVKCTQCRYSLGWLTYFYKHPVQPDASYLVWKTAHPFADKSGVVI